MIASQQVVVCQHDKQITQSRRHHSTDLVSAHTDSYLPAFSWWTTRKCKIVVRVWGLSVTDRSQSCGVVSGTCTTGVCVDLFRRVLVHPEDLNSRCLVNIIMSDFLCLLFVCFPCLEHHEFNQQMAMFIWKALFFRQTS